MYSDRVKRVQRLLRVEAGYTGAIDGITGARTLTAVARVPGARPCNTGRWATEAPIRPQASMAPMTSDDPPSTPKACST